MSKNATYVTRAEAPAETRQVKPETIQDKVVSKKEDKKVEVAPKKEATSKAPVNEAKKKAE